MMFLIRQIKVKHDDAAEILAKEDATNLLESEFECRHRDMCATNLRNGV